MHEIWRSPALTPGRRRVARVAARAEHEKQRMRTARIIGKKGWCADFDFAVASEHHQRMFYLRCHYM